MLTLDEGMIYGDIIIVLSVNPSYTREYRRLGKYSIFLWLGFSMNIHFINMKYLGQIFISHTSYCFRKTKLQCICSMGNLYKYLKPSFIFNFFQGLFYILVPEAINQRIQHGIHNGIKQWGHFILIKRVGRTWPKVCEE
jgi:hypothetical protein